MATIDLRAVQTFEERRAQLGLPPIHAYAPPLLVQDVIPLTEVGGPECRGTREPHVIKCGTVGCGNLATRRHPIGPTAVEYLCDDCATHLAY